MAHFATTALIRKRTGEKRSEKHNENTSKIHGKSNEDSHCFWHPFWIPFFIDFDLILASSLVPNRFRMGFGRAFEKK